MTKRLLSQRTWHFPVRRTGNRAENIALFALDGPKMRGEKMFFF
ncbi:hypothetical protein HMPREF1870_01777 [Bacteroidales bacterium KA00344]|nr:hypothetical protein HMPREF1870_01777 [Bacteroidales bacterium KA00344]